MPSIRVIDQTSKHSASNVHYSICPHTFGNIVDHSRHWFLRQTPTWAVGLLAQEKRETSHFILSLGRGQRSRQRRVVGVGRQLKGLPLELHQRLVTSSCRDTITLPVLHILQTPYVFCLDISKKDVNTLILLGVLQICVGECDWGVFVKTTTKYSAAAVAMVIAAANNTGSCKWSEQMQGGRGRGVNLSSRSAGDRII